MKIIITLCLLVFHCTNVLAQIDFSEKHHLADPLLADMSKKIKAGDYERIQSVLIAKDGKILFEDYFNGSNRDYKHNARSSTKTIATLLVGLAIDKGFIKSEKDKIYPYLQHKMPVKNPDPRKNNMIIEEFLTMSSILETDDNNYMSRGHEERMYFIEDWTQFLLDLPVRAYPFNPPPAKQPYGRFFHYSSAQAAVVSEIVESAIGSPADQFLINNLFDPLNITDYTLHYTPANIINTAGGSEYKSRDFLKMIQLFLQNGKWNEQQLISENYIKKATTPKARAREGVNYGYFLWINPFGKDKKYDAYYMSGNGGNKMVAIPDLNATVVITATNYNNRNAHGYSDDIMNQFVIPFLEKQDN